MRLHEEFGISVSDDTIYRALKELGFSPLSARPKAYKQDPEAMQAFKKTFPPAWRKSARNSRQAHREKGGSRTKCGSDRRTRLGRARDPAPRTIRAPSRPTCSVQFAPTAEPAQPSCYRPAIVKPCSFISTRSPPRSHWAPMPFSFLTKPVGTVPRNSGYCRRSKKLSRPRGGSPRET